MSKAKPAFTLIELLLAITIVGVLAGIIAYSVIGQQRKARDTERKSDLTQIKKAMESAKNDCHATSYYPIIAGADPTATFNSTADYFANPAIKLLDESVRDPQNTSTYVYTLHNSTATTTTSPNPAPCPDTSGDRTTEGIRNYVMRAKLEIANDPESTKSYNSCSSNIGAGISQIPTNSFNPPAAANDGYYYACPD